MNYRQKQIFMILGGIRASIDLLEDNTGTKLKETIKNDIDLLCRKIGDEITETITMTGEDLLEDRSEKLERAIKNSHKRSDGSAAGSDGGQGGGRGVCYVCGLPLSKKAEDPEGTTYCTQSHAEITNRKGV